MKIEFLPSPFEDKDPSIQYATIAPKCNHVFLWELREPTIINGLHLRKGKPLLLCLRAFCVGVTSYLAGVGVIPFCSIQGHLFNMFHRWPKGTPVMVDLFSVDSEPMEVELAYLRFL